MKKLILPVFLLANCFFANAQSAPPPTADSKQTVNPQEICEASLGILNLISTTGFGKLLGSIVYESKEMGLNFREYNSLEKFPYAQKTIIVDTNGLNRHRQLKALMFSETTSSDQLSKNAVGYFNAVGKLFETCLTPQKFEADYSAQTVKLHAIKMAYRYKMPSKDNGPFSSLQFGNTLVLEIYIDQKKNMDATYTYDFYLHFKRV
ncbi:MAG: hypothetical protein V4557_14130 [Bacteroidota bacterium]